METTLRRGDNQRTNCAIGRIGKKGWEKALDVS